MKLGEALKIAKVAGIVSRNVLLGGNLISLSLIKNPRQFVYYVSETLFLYKKLNAKTGIPQKNVNEVLPANNVEDIRLGRLDSSTWLWHASFTADLVNLCLICQIVKPKIVFEIGTLTGYTAFHFALNTADDARIYTLDLPKGEADNLSKDISVLDKGLVELHARNEAYAFEGTDVASKVTCLYGDSATFDFSPYHGRVDVFFVDGAHSYEYVRSDTLNALQCCHPGSVIAWHDFGRVGVNGVSKWIIELSKVYKNLYSIAGGSLAFMVVE